MHLYLDVELYDAMDAAAEALGQSNQVFIARAVEAAIAKVKPRRKEASK